MAPPRIAFRNVVKTFRTRNRSDSLRDALSRGLGRLVGRKAQAAERFTALDGVSWEVGESEVLGIVGANGAGKSTSLRLAAGVYPPNGGEVEVVGRVSALIELSAGFHPDLSGRENIYLGGALLGLRTREVDRVLPEIAAFADIGEFLESPVRTYSSGMAIRLGFAVAAHVPAEILLVDEVLAVGDMEFRAKCMRRMSERREEGTTVLFVSHNLSVIEQFCDRVLFLHRGKVLADGPPRETLAAYRAHIAEEARVSEVRESAAPQLRRGTGDVMLEEVEVGPLEAGGDLLVKGNWRTKHGVDDVLLGLSIHTVDGVLLGKSTTGPIDEGLSGTGAFAVTLPGLDLVPGRYEVSVFATDSSELLVYDMHQCLHPLTVSGTLSLPGADGLISLEPRWSVRRE